MQVRRLGERLPARSPAFSCTGPIAFLLRSRARSLGRFRLGVAVGPYSPHPFGSTSGRSQYRRVCEDSYRFIFLFFLFGGVDFTLYLLFPA